MKKLLFILLMGFFFVGFVGCDLFGGNTTTTEEVTTTTTTTRVTTTLTTTTLTTTSTTASTTTETPLTRQLRSIYQLAVEADAFDGTYEEWLETVRGPQGLPGEDGREVVLGVASGFIRWQYAGDTTWTNLVSLASLTGAQGLAGQDGKEVTFQVSEGYIQWQYVGDTTWTNLIELATLVGPAGADGINGIDGKEVTFQVSEGYIQWQYVGDTTWANLIELATLVGPAGQDGLNGIDGKEVTFQVSEGYIQWQYVGDTTWTNLIELATLVGLAGADGINGIDGKEVTFQVSEGYIQWQYVGDTTWTNLIELATLVGPAGQDGLNGIDGKEVTFQVSEGYIQWQYVGDTTWTNLIELATLVGPAGADGINGIDGKEVTFQVSEGYIQWQYVGDTTWANLIELASLVGPAGADGINGIDGKEVTFQVSEGYIQWQYIGDMTWTNLIELATLVGPAGQDGLNGIDGKEVTFQVSEGYIQWQYVGDMTWTNLIELATLVGPAGQDGLNGIDGKEVTFQVSEGYIQWQYVDDTTWSNLIELATLVGPAGADGINGIDGKEVSFQVSEGYIQWQYVGDTTWTNLIELASLVGPAGQDGLNGIDGKEVTFQVSEGYIQWQYVGETTWANLIEIATLVGPQGITGIGIESAVINEIGELIITYTDSTVVNLGQLLKVYQVVFKDYNGYVVDVQHILHGQSATLPSNPSRIGYSFDEWDTDVTVITQDLIVNATYMINTYQVEFYAQDGVTVLSTQTVDYGSGALAPEAPTIEGYTFIGWSEAYDNIVSHLQVFAIYHINVYQVVFYDYNGAILSIQNIMHGNSATDPGAGPREGYQFDQWDQQLTNIVSNMSIYALYVPIQYTVTYYDRDYNIIATELVDYQASGSYPTAPSVTGYDFIGWDKSVDRIVSDLDVLALYEIKVLTVTFRALDGSIFDLQYVEYGSDASNPGHPEMVGYSFTSWSANYTNVTTDLNLTPNYTRDSYTVKFFDESLTLIEEQVVLYGDDAIDPYLTYAASIDKTGYNFTGWSEDINHITSDLNCYPEYQILTFEVRFVEDNGLIFDIQTVEYGADAYQPLVPSRAGHTFNGWDTDFTNVTSDLTVTATYTINTYSVSFYNIDGVIFASVLVDYHDDAVAPTAPVVVGYKFIGWDTSYERVEGDLHVYAIYELLSYNVTFYDINGLIIEIQTINHGLDAIAPDDMAVVGYTFDGWDQTLSNVTSHMDVYPLYTVLVYTVTFEENGGSTVSDLTDVEHGSSIGIPIPTKLGYKFLGWFVGETETDAKFYATSKVENHLTLYARWELAFYDVIFYDYDGTLLRSLIVGHGYSAIAPDDPSCIGYTFTGWSESFLSVNNHLDIYAQYTPIIYDLIIVENGGDPMEDLEVAYETLIPVIDDPVRTGYTFLGWFEDSEFLVPFTTTHMPLNGMTIYAKWVINQYTISFEENGGSLVDDITQNYGTSVTEPSQPTWLAKTFLGWYVDAELTELYVFDTMPAENITLYAKWEDTLYTITFEENGGSEIADIEAIYQASISEPTAPTREGYIFDGYYQDMSYTIPFVFDTMPLGGDIVYVKWLLNEYELSYVAYQDLDIKLFSTNNHSIFVTEDNQVFTIGGGGNGELGNNATNNSSVLINITANFGFEPGEEVVYVEATYYGSYLLTSHGRLFTWGRNNVGQLGDGTTVNKSVPVDITSFFALDVGETITSIALSDVTTFAMTSSNRVFAWGQNNYNQLALDSYSEKQLTPVDITSKFETSWPGEYVIMIAASQNSTFFVTNEQRILAIGSNWYGSLTLANGPTSNSLVLVDVTANFNLSETETVSYIGLGYEFGGLLTSENRVLMWGKNGDYQLGMEVLGERYIPVDITSFFELASGETISQLSIQYNSSVALSSAGRIFTWGDSSSYQTGTGNQTDVIKPKDITGSFRLFADETLVSMSVSKSYANMILTSRGRYFAFGNNGAGGLLDLPTLKYTPTLTAIKEYTNIGSDMFDFGETIVLPGYLVYLGHSIEGWYMDSAYTMPYDMTTMPSEAVTIYAKWVPNQYTILFEENGGNAIPDITQNYGTTVSSPTPTREGYTFVGWYSDIALTQFYRFATMEAEHKLLYAKWTINSYNIQYYDVQGDYEFTQIALGNAFNVALTSRGQIFTWGYNYYGQLGDGTTTNRNYPLDITNRFNLYADEVFIHVNVGDSHALAVTSLGRVFTWGYNYYGQLGDNSASNKTTPIEITNNFGLIGEEIIVKVFGGDSVSYAISSTGRLFAWGSNSDFKIGDGTQVHRYLPKDITNYFNLGEGETIAQMHPGNRCALAVSSLGRIFTWGYDGGVGTLARGDVYYSSTPFDVTANFNLNPMETISQISFGKFGGIVITSSARIITWGYNDYYELATGDNLKQWYPVDVTANIGLAAGEMPIKAIMGYSNTMIYTTFGRIMVIGKNSFGSLATGDTIDVTTITEVTNNFSFDSGDTILDISLSRYNYYGFVLTSKGRLITWGNNYYGSLGDGTNINKYTPVQLSISGWHYYNSSNFDYQADILLLPDPTREGYTFDGWYTDQSLSTPFVVSNMPANDITLYGKWTIVT